MTRWPLDFTPGSRFGRLTVLRKMDYQSLHKSWFWLCRCDCGKEWPVLAGFIGKSTLSCGCLARDRSRIRLTKHGLAGTPTWRSYYAARDRCTRPTHKNYRYYGGRGIEFRFTNIQQLVDEIGPRPVGMTLDRKDPNGHYESGNIRWATPKDQEANKRRHLP